MAKQTVPVGIPKRIANGTLAFSAATESDVFAHSESPSRKKSPEGDYQQTPDRRNIHHTHSRNGSKSEDRRSQKMKSNSSSATSSPPFQTHDIESDSEDNYGEEFGVGHLPNVFTQARNGRKGVFHPPQRDLPVLPSEIGAAESKGEDDDEVPIAHRIPQALESLESIRKQVREENDQREWDRRSDYPTPPRPKFFENLPSAMPLEMRGRNISPRQPLAELQGSMFSPKTKVQSKLAEGTRRARSHHRPGEPVTIAFPADDLTRRLLRVQAQGQPRDSDGVYTSASSAHQHPQNGIQPQAAPSASYFSHASHSSQPPSSTDPYKNDMAGHPLRHMRSFHGTSSNYPHSSGDIVPTPPLKRPSSSRTRNVEDTNENAIILGRAKSIKSTRPSFDEPRSHYSTTDDFQPPVPPLPASTKSAMPSIRSASPPKNPASGRATGPTTQMRIFVGNLQRFNMVEIGAHTMAKDVLEIVRSHGDVHDDERTSGGWMVFELCQDFGMGEYQLTDVATCTHW